MAKQLSFNDLAPTQPAFFDVPDVEVKTNAGQIQAKISESFNKGAKNAASSIQKGFSQALDKSMEFTGWSWPRNTLRKNNTTAGLSRNIVDMGSLKSSKTTTLSSIKGGAGANINFTYNSPYAGFVHYGGVVRPYGNPSAPTVVLPGRPWILSTLEGSNGIPAFDFKTPFMSAVKSAL